jgi:hypothetical protein
MQTRQRLALVVYGGIVGKHMPLNHLGGQFCEHLDGVVAACPALHLVDETHRSFKLDTPVHQARDEKAIRLISI